MTGLAEGTPVVAGGEIRQHRQLDAVLLRKVLSRQPWAQVGWFLLKAINIGLSQKVSCTLFVMRSRKWHLMGVMLSAAGSFQWYKNNLGGEEQATEDDGGKNAYDLLTAGAANVQPGCEGLVFLPYLSGERTPHPDPHARGAFVGLT